MEELSLALLHMMKESSIANDSLANEIHTHSPGKTNPVQRKRDGMGGLNKYGKAGMGYFEWKELNRFDQRRLYAFRRIYWIEDK